MNGQSTVILEIGSHVLRCGVAGEVAPRVALLWTPAELIGLPEPRAREVVLRILYDLIFTKLTFRPKDCRVLVVEALASPSTLRQLISSVLLRDLMVVSVSLQPDVCMAALASGLSNGVVLDIGHTESRAVAFADGYIVLQSIAVSPTGMSAGYTDLRHRVAAIVGDSDLPSAEVAAKIFQRTARRNPPLEVTIPYINTEAGTPLIVPGEMIAKSLLAVTRGEVYSGSGGIDKDELGGAAGALLQCLKNCSPDVRARVSSHVVVCGGGGCVPGIASVILEDAHSLTASEPEYQELRALVSNSAASMGVKLAPTTFLPSNTAWVGGSLFASLQANDSRFVKLDDIRSDAGLRLPDWLSLDAKDWVFFAPKNNCSRA